MRILGRIGLSVLICILVPVSITGQIEPDSLSVNLYSSVLEIFNAADSDKDSVRVSNPELFNAGDTSLFHIARGAEIYNSVDHPGIDVLWGKIFNMNNTGVYSIMIIESVSDSVIIFSESLPELINSSKPQMAQLLRIRTAKRLIIDTPLRCKPWDPETGTGGLLVLMANQSITISSTIDVSGTGFRGGQPSIENFGDSCISVPDEYYRITAADSAGMKGESIIHPGFPFPLGTGSSATGGGGGNGRFAGGGGGGNYGLGGNGGKESELCNPLNNLGGRSNYINPGYFNNSNSFGNRLYFGGGGGSSTQNLPDHRASAGGSGGGIILLLTDSLICTGNDTIRANGQSVTDTATAGAGGGGGGGFIVIDARIITGNLHLEVKGGDGGNTNDSLVTGPGGFGGAGLIWFCQDSLPENLSIDTLNGDPGKHLPTGFHYGATTTKARNGNILAELVSPLKGFLFNHAVQLQSLCSAELNSPIRASHAKGGTGSYIYHWEISDDQSTWNTAPGISDEKDYLPGESGSGKYFRRIVSSGDIIDTGKHILFNHYPEIMYNLVEGQAIYCTGENTGDLVHSGQAVEGGSGIYSYLWQQKTGDENWETAAGTANQLAYSPAPLDQTTLFRRIVQSEACLDTSNTVEITIKQAITIIQQPLNDTVIIGNSAIFTVKAEGNQPVYYQWYHNSNLMGGETKDSLVIHNVSSADQGEYYCLISNTCGETESQYANLLLESPEGIADTGRDQDIKLYPNPAGDLLYIDHPQGREFEIQVYDLLGNRIMVSRKAEVIDVSGLSPGIYLVKLMHTDQHGVKVVRLEISR